MDNNVECFCVCMGVCVSCSFHTLTVVSKPLTCLCPSISVTINANVCL